jgi:hypothetical protein
MAQYDGVNVTKYEAPGNANWIDQGLIKSELKVWSDSYELAGTEVANDTFHLATLPAGAKVHLVHCAWDDVGAASATFDVGDSDDPNRYLDGLVASAAGQDTGILPDGAQYEIGTNDGDTEILVSLLDANADAAGTLKLTVFYTN